MDSINPTLDDLQRRFEITFPALRISKSLRTLVTEGNVNPDDIISLLRLEPLLAVRMLREANQLSTADSREFASIEEAVTAIGFQRMYDLLGLYAYPNSTDELRYSTDLWKRAITCAVCMEKLADKHGIDASRAYTVGLIHSLAEAILEAETGADKRVDLSATLQSCIKSQDLSGICYSLLKDWGLPASIIDPIRYQYAPLDCQTTGKMACLLNLAKWITGVVRDVDELPDQASGPDLLVLNLLGEGEQTLWDLVTEVSNSLLRADAVVQGDYSSSC